MIVLKWIFNSWRVSLSRSRKCFAKLDKITFPSSTSALIICSRWVFWMHNSVPSSAQRAERLYWCGGTIVEVPKQFPGSLTMVIGSSTSSTEVSNSTAPSLRIYICTAASPSWKSHCSACMGASLPNVRRWSS